MITSQNPRKTGDKIPVSKLAKKWPSLRKPERNGHLQPKDWLPRGDGNDGIITYIK